MKIRYEQGDLLTTIYISGAIDETTEGCLEENQTAFQAPNLAIHCAEVTSINSIGVSHWVHFFTHLVVTPVISFYEVPEILMDAAQSVRFFFGAGAVKSFYIVGNCDECDTYTRQLFESESLKHLDEFPAIQCEKCGKPTEVDDELGDYKVVLAYA